MEKPVPRPGGKGSEPDGRARARALALGDGAGEGNGSGWASERSPHRSRRTRKKIVRENNKISGILVTSKNV